MPASGSATPPCSAPLGFFGLGVQPGRTGLDDQRGGASPPCCKSTYMLIVPALSILSLILGFNLLADGLREMSLRD